MLSGLFKSKGLKRNLASILAFVSFAAQFVPALAPFQELLINISGVLGGVGVAHAAASGSLVVEK